MKLLPSIELLSNIGQVLKGNRKQSGGYKWKYQMNLKR